MKTGANAADRFVYTVFPFSGEAYRKNEGRLKEGEVPCAICGRAVARPWRFSAVVVNGGDWARSQVEAENVEDPGYMGVWPIGPDCHRRFLDPAASGQTKSS